MQQCAASGGHSHDTWSVSVPWLAHIGGDTIAPTRGTCPMSVLWVALDFCLGFFIVNSFVVFVGFFEFVIFFVS